MTLAQRLNPDPRHTPDNVIPFERVERRVKARWIERKEQMGLPFRKYVLWRKLTRAMVAIGGERTIADAARAADFSDAAHLTRTFYQMLGIAPSALMRGHFAEISSPFSAAS